MPNISLAPLGDWLNAGWALVGAVSKVWQALASMSDTIYIKAPGSKGGAAITFPSDIASVPEGAIITSVTIMVRAGLGAGTPPAGVSPSLTLNVAAQDNPSRYTAKTIYPTSTITDYEVGTYQRDAIGRVWDIFRLNFLFCRVFCWIGIVDLVRVYRIWLQVNYRVRPVISIESPSGTVYTPSPDISWLYTQADGDPQKYADYKIFTADQVSKVSFNPSTAVTVFEGRVDGDTTIVKLPTSINSNSYWVYVQAVSSFGAKSVWTGRQFTVQGPTPGAPGLSDPNLPGTSTVVVVPDSEYGRASLAMRDTSNMLSVQAADAEGAVDGAEWTTSNCSYVRDSSTSFPGGTSSWKITATAAGDVGLVGDWIEVEPGIEITGRVQTLAAATSRQTRVRVSYFDDTFTQISSATGSAVSNATGTWTEAVYSLVVPAETVYARMTIEILGCAISEVHNIDRAGLMYGANTPWSDGGHMGRNMLSAWYSSCEGTPQAGESWVAGSGSSVSTIALPYGTGSSGSVANTVEYVGLAPSIALRAAGTAFTSPTAGTDYTLNKPAGVVAGDLMLAFVTTSEFTTITPPIGWDLAAMSRAEDGSTDVCLFVLKRTVEASDPASWTDGVVDISSPRRTAYVVAYSGAASAAEQFVGQTEISTGNDTPLHLTTSALTNTDPNAWRVSAFAVSDNVSGGSMNSNRQAPSTIPAIAYVGESSLWGTYNSTSSTYTINRPSGIIAGDLMVAIVSASTSNISITPPAGWTVRSVDSVSPNTSAARMQAILTRYATSSEPSAWTVVGGLGAAARMKLVHTLAYRNVDPTTPFLDNASATHGSGTSLTTATITNTNSMARRIFAVTGSVSYYGSSAGGWSSNEAVERGDWYSSYNSSSGDTIQGSYDSNGSIPTGTTNRIAYSKKALHSAISWIGLLNPLGSPVAPVPSETARQVAATGASNPYLTTRTFDSNGPAFTGSQSITGIWTPSSGTDKNSMAAWQGLIKPAAAVVAGYAQAQMASPVDISEVDMKEIVESGHVTLTASFIGDSSGTSFLTALFYRANVLLGTSTGEGSQFNTTYWVKSSATFAVPEGTTRISMMVSASDREVGDVTAYDRCSIAFGSGHVYRPGTSSPIHPIFSKPQIQYADDDGTGYGDWLDLPGVQNSPPVFQPLNGLARYNDETTIPLTSRRYRSRTTSFGLNGDLFVSNWSTASSEVYFEAENWWMKSLSNPEWNIRLKVKWDSITVATTNTAASFQPLGEQFPVVLTEGYKGDSFSVSLIPVDHDGWVSLRRMLESGQTLLLQSDIDHAWFVRPVGDLSAVVLATNSRRRDPLREITVQFVQVEPEK